MRTLPTRVLANPTEETFQTLLATATDRHPRLTRQSLADLGLTLSQLQGPEGYLEISLLRLFAPEDRGPRRSAVTCSWWTNPAGVRYLRLDGYARVNGALPSKRFSGVPRAWAAVFLERAEKLEQARATRLDALITRHLGGPNAPKLVIGETRPTWLTHQLPAHLESGRLAAASPDGLLVIDNWERPKRAGLIFQSASGTYRLHDIPTRFADRKSRTFLKGKTPTARVQAAIAWLLAQQLDGREP